MSSLHSSNVEATAGVNKKTDAVYIRFIDKQTNLPYMLGGICICRRKSGCTWCKLILRPSSYLVQVNTWFWNIESQTASITLCSSKCSISSQAKVTLDTYWYLRGVQWSGLWGMHHFPFPFKSFRNYNDDAMGAHTIHRKTLLIFLLDTFLKSLPK